MDRSLLYRRIWYRSRLFGLSFDRSRLFGLRSDRSAAFHAEFICIIEFIAAVFANSQLHLITTDDMAVGIFDRIGRVLNSGGVS